MGDFLPDKVGFSLTLQNEQRYKLLLLFDFVLLVHSPRCHEFVGSGGDTHVRVYYQNEDCHIKESCYDTKNGWHARATDVAVTARKDSPIAVASWNKGT
jgi:hypothetical protein